MTKREHASPYSKILMRAVADKVRHGLSVGDACECYGMSPEAVSNACERYGRNRGEYYESLSTHDRTSADTVDLMRELRSAGMTVEDIADACRVCTTTVKRYTRDVTRRSCA